LFSAGHTVMTTIAILKSYNSDENSAIVSVDGTGSDVVLRLCGSDRLAPLKTDRVAQPTVPKRSSKGGRKETKSGQPRASQPHVTLEELLSSCVVRQMMERDCVDAEDIRRLISLMANRSPADRG
jgi:hypothetical protein